VRGAPPQNPLIQESPSRRRRTPAVSCLSGARPSDPSEKSSAVGSVVTSAPYDDSS
jgi:hypothetical protein